MLAEWNPNERRKAFVLITNIKRRESKGNVRWTATFADMSASIAAVDWDGILAEMSAGFAAVEVEVGEYGGEPQLTVIQCRPVNDADGPLGFDPDTLVPNAPEDAEALEKTLSEARETLGEMAGRCWDTVLELYGDEFRIWPASMILHHAYRRGLLQHITGMLKAAQALVPVYGLDSDVLLLGVLMHDIGKLRELGSMPGEGRTIRGATEGHLVTGYLMWQEVAAEAEASKGFTGHVGHLILSHHGQIEYGSPVRPVTREALALHMIDNLDSQLEMVRIATQKAPDDLSWHRKLGDLLGRWSDA